MEDEGPDTDCPVCLEDTRLLPTPPVTIPCCHKLYCEPCIAVLVGVRKGDAPIGADGVARNMAHVLICPTCRAEHHVPNTQKWTRMLMLDADDSAWGGTDTRALLVCERDDAAAVDPQLCSALSREELVAVCAAANGLQISAVRAQLSGLDRAKLVAEAAKQLGRSSGESLAVSELSIRAARAVLTLRDIPFDDLLEKSELCSRVEQCHRGACARLPTKLLKSMLRAEGLGDEIFVDKAVLVRRLMAVRALKRQAAQRRAEQTPLPPPVSATPLRPAAPPLAPPSAQPRPARPGFRGSPQPDEQSGGCQCNIC